MDHKAISQQLLLEQEMLTHITHTLRTILDWKDHEYDLSRKLTSLRFMVQSFRRHLDHLMGLEEYDGYMEVVVESRPEMTRDVEMLKNEHELFRAAIRRIDARLERTGPTDHRRYDEVGAQLLDLLQQVDAHSAKETDLLQRALLSDEGGSG